MFRFYALCLLLAAPGVPAETLKDPTQPPVVHQAAVRRLEVQAPEHYTLSAIKISGAERRALINGHLLSEGESLGEAKIVEILEDAVIVEYLSEQRRIMLLPQQIRRETTGP